MTAGRPGVPPSALCILKQFGGGGGLPGRNGDRMRLLEGAQRWAVCDVDACQLESPRSIIAAAGVKLRAMVGKRQQVSLEKASNPDRAASICASASA